MFLWSFKIDKKKSYISLIIAVIVCVSIFCMSSFSDDKATISLNKHGTNKSSTTASNNEERVAYIESLGWQIEKEPEEIEEIIIPQKFDEVYEEYNDLQKEQGMDLEKYAGKNAKRYIYKVTNYPNESEDVYLTLLIRDNRIIGGDISSSLKDGFMKPLHNTSEI